MNIFGGYARINSDFYGIGKENSSRDISVLLEENVKFLAFQITPKWHDLYIGPTLTYTDVENHFDIQGLPPDLVPVDKLEDETWIPGLKLQADERDNTFYPTNGYLSNVSAQFHDKNLSGSYTFQQYKANHNQYIGLGDERVVALRFNIDAAVGEVPFYDLPSFGQGQDMRGYKAGKYRDKFIWDAQAEYRQRWTDHWGGVVFGGVGDVLPSVSDFDLHDLLWAGGIGARYRIAVQNPIDFRVDLAYGDKEWSAYFSVNQAY
jgi:outer membrane translocation and assembly module TamA